jgi:hypothetical protein
MSRHDAAGVRELRDAAHGRLGVERAKLCGGDCLTTSPRIKEPGPAGMGLSPQASSARNICGRNELARGVAL